MALPRSGGQAGGQENEEEGEEDEIKGDLLRFGKVSCRGTDVNLVVPLGLRINRRFEFSRYWRRGKEGRFFSEMEDFFCSVGGGREKCRKRGRKQEAARKRRDSIGAMTARPVLRFHRRARERALVSREFDRYSGINS